MGCTVASLSGRPRAAFDRCADESHSSASPLARDVPPPAAPGLEPRTTLHGGRGAAGGSFSRRDAVAIAAATTGWSLRSVRALAEDLARVVRNREPQGVRCRIDARRLLEDRQATEAQRG